MALKVELDFPTEETTYRKVSRNPSYDYRPLENLIKKPYSEEAEFQAFELIYSLKGPLPSRLLQQIETKGYFQLYREIIEAELDRPWQGICREDKFNDLMKCGCNGYPDTCRFCCRKQRFARRRIPFDLYPEQDLARYCFKLGQTQGRASPELRAEITTWLCEQEGLYFRGRIEHWKALLKDCGY